MTDGKPLVDMLHWTADALLPAIVQDADSGEVLMMAWMNREALQQTLKTGESHFYSRSRRAAWHKGGTSGHVQKVEEVRIDCDGDVVLLRVRQTGGACHKGFRSCFFRTYDANRGELAENSNRVFDPGQIYADPNAAHVGD